MRSTGSVLGVDIVPLSHLRWMSGDDVFDGVSFDSAFETMLAMRAEGRIEHVGLSNITLPTATRATRAARATRRASTRRASEPPASKSASGGP